MEIKYNVVCLVDTCMYIFPTISIYVLFPLKARASYFMGYVVLQLNKR